MSDRMSEKKAEDSMAGAPKGNVAAVAAAARAAVDQGMQAGAKAAETGAGAIRDQAAAMPVIADKATAATRQGAAQFAEAAEQTTRQAADSAERMTSTIKSTMERAMNTTEEMVSFGQGNIEAFVKSGQIWANGLQDLGRHVAQSAQAQIDGTVSALKAMASVKSVHEAIELQSSMARSALEKAVQDGGKLTDASMKLAEQTMAPITARMSYVTERFGRVAA